AIADYDEIRKEMKLALMECGRKLGTYLNKRLKMRRESERRDVFERYIGEIAKACNAINGADAKKLYEAMLMQAKKRTAIADLQLDEEGKKVKEEDPADQDGVIIVEKAMAPIANSSLDGDSPPVGVETKAEKAMKVVAARARQIEEDEQPRLIEKKGGSPATRSKPPKPKVSGDPTPKAPKPDSPKPSSKAAGASAPKSTSPAAKPKMRLVNGKLVPADQPGLF
ncbi:MAG: hypothetical protein JNK16_11150, partial [Phycisphaerales bacterium]|nr:hypothetical protein [Phycisphaerales bacterium]